MPIYLTVRDLYTVRNFYEPTYNDRNELISQERGDTGTLKNIDNAITKMHFNEDDIDDMILTMERTCRENEGTEDRCNDREKEVLLKLKKLSLIHQQARLSSSRRRRHNQNQQSQYKD